MIIRSIRRMLSIRDFQKAEKLVAAGDYNSAWVLIERAKARTGTEVLQPHIFEFEYLIKKGQLPEGLEKRKIIELELDRRSKMKEEEKNFIRYYMLRILPDDYLSSLTKVNISDPAVLGLHKVFSVHRIRYPYIEPRPEVARLLKGSSTSKWD